MAHEISVFLENKVGHFEQITRILRDQSINIRSLTLNNILHGWGVLNLLVDRPEVAYMKLTEAGHSVVLREVIALEMKDKAGGLDELLVELSKTGIHFENASTRILSSKQMAILILEVPDLLEARERLEKNGIPILSDAVVYNE
jgi:hypothetical protein